MRFLCLHGMGTNSKNFNDMLDIRDADRYLISYAASAKGIIDADIFLAAIRHGIGSEHTYEFIDGAVPAKMAPGVESIAGPDDEFLQYADLDSQESCLKALHDLEALVDEEGPFDGVIGFSLGATLIASLMVYKLQKNPEKERLQPTFRCAIFFCGGIPEVLHTEDGISRRVMSYEEDGEVIGVPTAHIWGANDYLWPNFGTVLCKLCRRDQRDVFIHGGGHEIPGPKDEASLLAAIRVIKRTIARASQ